MPVKEKQKMKLYNTLTRRKQEFKPVIKGIVRMYTCGPTVYNYAHIGNLRTFLFEDLLRRWLKHKGYRVKQAMNLTDIDDKTILGSQKERTSLKEFTEKYTKAFFEDIDALKIERAEVYPKATEHIKEMVAIIKLLLKKGLAYKTDDGVYYSISQFKKYGKLARVDTKKLKPGASGRVKTDEYEKENIADFALWKFWDEKDGEVYWQTEFGKGRPGWHVECSAMSAKHLADAFSNNTFNPEKFKTIDIHTGGVDNIFPHHEDEIAQTEGCIGRKFVNYWMHSEHLMVEGRKMAKSSGNFYTLRDLVQKGRNPIAIRYLLLSAHYRQKLNFTFKALEGAATTVQRINDFVKRVKDSRGNEENKEVKEAVKKAKAEFEKSLDNDLEISQALAAVFTLIGTVNKELKKGRLGKEAGNVLEFIQDADKILGILERDEELAPETEKMLKEREMAREIKNWARADQLREELRKKGIATEDTPYGQRWKRIL